MSDDMRSEARGAFTGEVEDGFRVRQAACLGYDAAEFAAPETCGLCGEQKPLERVQAESGQVYRLCKECRPKVRRQRDAGWLPPEDETFAQKGDTCYTCGASLDKDGDCPRGCSGDLGADDNKFAAPRDPFSARQAATIGYDAAAFSEGSNMPVGAAIVPEHNDRRNGMRSCKESNQPWVGHSPPGSWVRCQLCSQRIMLREPTK